MKTKLDIVEAKALAAEVEEDLKQEDPQPVKAKAAIDAHTEGDDGKRSGGHNTDGGS